MSNNNMNQVFVLPDGSEIKVVDSYMGRYLQVPIQRIYEKPEHQDKNQMMVDKWKNLDCRKVEVHKNYFDIKRGEEQPAIETVIIAENKTWIEYPLTKTYTGEHACNCDYYTKVEVVLMDDEYTRRLFFDWKGTLSVFDFMEDLGERILEELLEEPEKHHATVLQDDEYDPLIELEFYTDEGDFVRLEIEGKRDIEKRIASVRVIKHTSEIKKQEHSLH